MFTISSEYSYEDLNRVGLKLEELFSLVSSFGFSAVEDIKTDWAVGDFPYLSLIDKIRNNINWFHEFLYLDIERLSLLRRRFGYLEANELEVSLVEIEKAIDEVKFMLIRLREETCTGWEDPFAHPNVIDVNTSYLSKEPS
jgi:hypothetical protein